MIINWVINILKSLNSNQNPRDIAAGVALGLLLALVPSNNLLWFLLFFVTFFLGVNLGAELIFTAIFKLIAPLFDSLLHTTGYAVLTLPALQPFFTMLYNTPIIPFTKFNNTIVMGGLVIGLILLAPMIILFTWLVKLYREKLLAAIANSKIVKGFMNLPIVSTIAGAFRKASDVYSATR